MKWKHVFLLNALSFVAVIIPVVLMKLRLSPSPVKRKMTSDVAKGLYTLKALLK